MRVLCVAAAYPPYVKGGGSKGSENIAKALSDRGHTVRVITVADEEKFEIREGIEVKTLSTLNIYWNYWIKQSALAKLLWHALENFNPRALLRIRQEIAEFRADIVVTISIENVNVATWVAAWMLGCPCVHVIQSYFLMCWRGTMFSNNKNCKRPCLQCRMGSIGKKVCSQLVDGVTAEATHTLSSHHECGYFRRATSRDHSRRCEQTAFFAKLSYHGNCPHASGIYRNADAEQRYQHIGRGSSPAGQGGTV